MCRTFKAVRINSDQYSIINDIVKSDVIRRCFGRRPIAAHVNDVTRSFLATSTGKETMLFFVFVFVFLPAYMERVFFSCQKSQL